MEFIIHVIIFIISEYLLSNHSYFVKLMTLDSLYNCCYFIKYFFNPELTQSQIVEKTSILYKHSLLDRYIYYFLLFLGYKLISLFFWTSDFYSLSIACIFTIIPNILNWILSLDMFSPIVKAKEYFVKIVISKLLTMLIKFCSKLYLDKDAQIKKQDIIVLLSDYDDMVNNFKMVTKNVAVALLLMYIKSYDGLYYGIIKYLYNYQTGNLVESYSVESAREHLGNIIDHKRWHELTNPNTYKALLYLYDTDKNKKMVIQEILVEYNFLIVKVFSIWTISSIFNNLYIIPIFSLLIILYDIYFRKINDSIYIPKILLTLCSVPSIYYHPQYLSVIFISNILPYLLFNKITYVIFKTIRKKMCQFFKIIVTENSYLHGTYILTCLYIVLLKYLDIKSSLAIISFNIVANVFMDICGKKQMIFILLVIPTYFSSFNLIHMFSNLIIIYLFSGSFDLPSLNYLMEYFYYVINSVEPMYKNFICKRHKIVIKDNFIENNKIKNEFRTMDIEKFPSISKLSKKISSKKYNNKENNKEHGDKDVEDDNLTNFSDLSNLSNLSISSVIADDIYEKNKVSLEDSIFQSKERIFINKISVSDDEDNQNENNHSIKDSQKVENVKIHDQNVNIISNFL